LYYDRSLEIFGSGWYVLREGWLIIRAHYSTRRSREELTGMFGHTRLRDLNNKVFVASFDLMDEESASRKPKFFHNFSGRDTVAIYALLTLRSSRGPDEVLRLSAPGTLAHARAQGGVLARDREIQARCLAPSLAVATSERPPGFGDYSTSSRVCR